MGSAHPLNGPYQAFQTSDGWITLGAANQKNWLTMLDVLEALEIADDPRFRENIDRMAHLKELEAVLSPILVEHSTDDWLQRLQEAGVPAGPVLNVNQMHEDPHTLARDMIVEVEHSRLGPVKTIGLPVKFSETPGRVAKGAPVYGQHTREVLAEYGYDQAAVDEMIANGAVVEAD
jgi:crotonobetainyl-CoA:carnitine CoA-transferase CaiB-like acyl-CoA transferase